ncbi:hypothetical protein BH09BAC6_BH09BAC6_33080 [soil metagenome]|jgi:uncharacterized damage-inducible protein DinB
MENKKEVWLRGPLDDVPVLVQPVAHALLQAREELNTLMKEFPDALLWEKPAGLASPGFHLKHLSGVLDRLFTYARGEQLNQQQSDELAAEGDLFENAQTAHLVEIFNRRVDAALTELRKTNAAALTERRGVGRAQLPSTVIGLFMHSAEHTMRHLGQLLVTVKILRS